MVNKKVCYIYAGPFVATDIGIQKKITAQASVINNHNLPIKILIISHKNSSFDLPENVQFIELPKCNWIKRQIFICKSITKFTKDYQAIILRGIAYSPFFYFILRNLKPQLCLEIHTKVFKELLCHKRYLNYFIQRLSLPFCNKLISKKITVTQEIKDYEISYNFPEDCTSVISNGVMVNDVNPLPCVPFDGEHISMVFIASNFQPWHGLDRLINSINAYSGDIKISLNIIGNVDEEQVPKSTNHNFIYHGCIYDTDQLDHIYSNCNLAISSLALYHNQITEACVLKTREYILKGLPFIYAYNDTDLINDVPFCLKFPNDASHIPIEKIIEFLGDISDDFEKIRLMSYDFAIENLSWESKLNTLITSVT